MRTQQQGRVRPTLRAPGIAGPGGERATSAGELHAAIARFDRWLAKPVFSRAGTKQATNAGPRAGELDPADCRPTPEAPWLVQEYLDGRDVSSLSVAHQGRIALHCAYELPTQATGGYGLRYRSIEDPGMLSMVERVVADTSYTGFIGLDCRLGDALRVIECNPRCSPGALLFDRAALVAAILDSPPPTPAVVGPGASFEFGTLLALDALQHTLPRTIHDLLTTPDAFGELDDPLPLLYRFVAVHHDERVAARTRRAYAEAFRSDLVWEPSATCPRR